MDERTYQPLLDKLYISRGYQIKRINGEANRAYDVELVKPKENKIYKVEEKGLVKTDALAFEIDQDISLYKKAAKKQGGYLVPPNALGNQFTTEATVQIWFCGTPMSYTVYQVWTEGLHMFYLCKENFPKFKLQPIPKGFGLTVCAFIPWYVLERQKIAKKIYPDEMPNVFEPKPIEKAA